MWCEENYGVFCTIAYTNQITCLYLAIIKMMAVGMDTAFKHEPDVNQVWFKEHSVCARPKFNVP